MLLLHVLGSLRRLSSNGLLHTIVSGAYTLSFPLVSYTIGSMKHSPCYHVHFAIWAVFLLLLLGNTDSLTACRLSDIDNWKSIYVKHLFKGFLMVYVLLRIYGYVPALGHPGRRCPQVVRHDRLHEDGEQVLPLQEHQGGRRVHEA